MTTTTAGPIDRDLDRWRADTPGTRTVVHLNNAGAALMPRSVVDAIRAQIDLEAEIGGYEAAASVADRVEATYTDLGLLLHAPAGSIAVVENATVAVGLALSAFDFAPGDAIVTTQNDYTSNQLMYLALAQRQGVEVLRAAELPGGGVDPDSVRELLRHPRCRLVALTWVPTNSGLVQAAEEVGAICRDADVPYLLDACQVVGQMPVDVERLGCDFLAGTARKFLRGPRGIGFLYVSERMLAAGRYPMAVDMRGATLVTNDHFELTRDARRFENWEFAYALVLGLGTAVRYALEVGVEVAAARSHELATLLRDRLAAVPGVELVEPGSRHCAIVTAAIDRRTVSDVMLRLRQRGINTSVAVRGPGPLTGAGQSLLLRLSPHYYNTEREIGTAVDAMAEIIGEAQAAAVS